VKGELMNNATIIISGEGVHDLNELNVQISVQVVVNVDAKHARQRATAWLVSEVGNMLMAGDPHLVIAQTTVWRLPVLLTSSEKGIVGEVGIVDVDAASGEPMIDDKLRTQIPSCVDRLVPAVPIAD
jgi:hypothetical protein